MNRNEQQADRVPSEGWLNDSRLPPDPRNPNRANPDFTMIRMCDNGAELDVNSNTLTQAYDPSNMQYD